MLQFSNFSGQIIAVFAFEFVDLAGGWGRGGCGVVVDTSEGAAALTAVGSTRFQLSRRT